jgi:endonuclease YncB( thermonuclease family)
MRCKAWYTWGVLLLAATPLWAAGPVCPVRATVEELHDADSPKVTIHLPFGVDLPHRDLRAVGYDAWEVSRTRRTVVVTTAEITKGKQARDELAKLIAGGTLYVEETRQSDPYGRTNAVMWVRRADGTWVDVAAWMLKNGHTRPTPPER